ncbi:MAG TPA: right-handed parallel beta-helix repeat-containing protein [Tepidiformaceae bacterium]|nr:right-handed parallel beta-helix repeat-containing protein [Tepidiformaceae bacterium]
MIVPSVQFGGHATAMWRVAALALLAFAVLAAAMAGSGLSTPLAHADGICTTTCYVATSGNGGSDANDGQQASPFLTVQKAVDTVQAGGTVIVGAGTFTEQVTIGKALTLEGAGAASTTIQMPNPTYGNPSTIIINAGVNDTVEIRNATISTNNVCGASIDIEAGNTNIHNNTISAPNPNGLCNSGGIVQQAGDSSITDNTISGAVGESVWVFAGSAAISGNTITGGTSHLANQGVEIDDPASATITNNTISGMKCIQSTYPSPPAPPNENTCDYGVNQPQMAAGIILGTSGNVTVTGNTLTDNDQGIEIFEFGSGTISGNSITSTYVGLFTIAQDVAFDDNTVNGGQYGIVMVSFPPAPPPYQSTPAPSLTGTGNVISGNGLGVYVFKYNNDNTAPDPTITLNRNGIFSNTAGYNNTSGALQDATCNWWGDASGPSGAGPGGGNSVSSDVTFLPWLVTNDLANGPCTGTAAVSATTTTASAIYSDSAPAPTVAITANVTSTNAGIDAPSGVGTVSFYNGGTLLCTVPLANGQAVCESAISPAGGSPHSLTVVYNGTPSFLSSSTTTDAVPTHAQPTLVSVTTVFPNNGAAWLVQGAGFSGGSSVTVCGVAVPFTIISDTVMLIGVPAVNGPQQCTITLVATGGTVSSPGAVTVVPQPQPGAPVVVFPTGPVTPSNPTPPPTQSCTNAMSTITLSGLWTLVAWPGASGTTVDVALSGGADHCGTNVLSQVAVVWGFDAATQTYSAFFPSAVNVPGANDLESLTQGLGYWVALKDPSSNVTWTVETA